MRNFINAKRIVVKIGTNVLSKGDSIDSAYVRRIAKQVNELLKRGRQVVIISSGAIGMGAGQLNISGKVRDMKKRQACAAIGQPLLMAEYKKAFGRYGITVAQVLLTTDVLNNRKSYLNLRNSVETLLKLGVLPVLNENDSVSTEEIGSAFGDNDKLSALVASKIDADLLIMLSDIDALYDKNPHRYKDAKPMDVVFEITNQIEQSAGKAGSRHATGGMKTKLAAAKIASSAGCRIVLADGRAVNIIGRIMEGKSVGTLFMPKRKLTNRKRWILNSTTSGIIEIDDGAMQAIRNRKSLLPKGIVSVKGNFDKGDVVMLNDQAKAVTSLSSSQLKAIQGKHSTEIRKQFGSKQRDVVAIPEDIVFIDY